MNSQDEILKRFGHRFRLIRERRGISQEKLALSCGFDRTYVSAVDRGKQNLTLINIHRFAEALDISPYLFFLPDDEFKEELSTIPNQGIQVGRKPKT